MKTPKILSFCVSLALLVSGSVFGATIQVPDDYATIQAAIDAAVDGDTVLVASGIHIGPIYFNGKKITVRSESGPKVTTIEGGVFFKDTEESLLEGFTTWGPDIWASSPTIKNCRLKQGDPGGVEMNDSIWDGSSPTFVDCKIYGVPEGEAGGFYDIQDSAVTFINCEVSDSNGWSALYIQNSSVTLENCTFQNNNAFFSFGGAINSESSSLKITKCKFINNYAVYGGAIFNEESSSIIQNCIFSGNQAHYFDYDWVSGGAIYNRSSSSSIISNCTFYNNTATSTFGPGEGEGEAIYNENSSPFMTNSIFWGFWGVEEPQILNDGLSFPQITYCNVVGSYPGEGNIDSDPLFVDPDNDDFHLQSSSPCINAGTAAGAPVDDFEGDIRPQGSGYDIGADEFVFLKDIVLTEDRDGGGGT